MHRGLQDFVIQQKSKTGMFNATDLVNQWNLTYGNSHNKKLVADLLNQWNSNCENSRIKKIYIGIILPM